MNHDIVWYCDNAKKLTDNKMFQSNLHRLHELSLNATFSADT